MYSSESTPISSGTRLGAMLLDHVFMTLIALIFILPSFISGISDAFSVSHEPENFDFITGSMKYIDVIGFALYFCKDIINGRSIAKRILKLQVVDNKTGQVATPLQCFIRDIFCIFWFIEGIVALSNTSRRIGDRVAGTKLVHYNPALDQPKINIVKTIIPVILSYILVLLIIQVMPSLPMSSTKIEYSKTSYNEAQSKELEKLMADNLGQYLTPDIRVYDSVQNRNLKYVSIILKLKENYIADNSYYLPLHQKVTELIYARLPMETFKGQIKYYFKGNGQFQTRIITIGAE